MTTDPIFSVLVQNRGCARKTPIYFGLTRYIPHLSAEPREHGTLTRSHELLGPRRKVTFQPRARAPQRHKSSEARQTSYRRNTSMRSFAPLEAFLGLVLVRAPPVERSPQLPA